MSTLIINKLESGAFIHTDSIDGEFFLGRFSLVTEIGKAFLVQAYGAKRREYVVTDISVFDFGGIEETFTNFTDLINRLTELGYSGIDTSGMIPIIEEVLITNASVTGTYNIDWSLADVWNLTLTGNTTLTESNLPTTGHTKTITLQISGNFTLSYPAGWTDLITGSYSGTAIKNTITNQFFGIGDYKVVIVQPD